MARLKRLKWTRTSGTTAWGEWTSEDGQFRVWVTARPVRVLGVEYGAQRIGGPVLMTRGTFAEAKQRCELERAKVGAQGTAG